MQSPLELLVGFLPRRGETLLLAKLRPRRRGSHQRDAEPFRCRGRRARARHTEAAHAAGAADRSLRC